MSLTLVIPQTLIQEINDALELPYETAGVLIAGLAEAPNGDIKLLAQKICWVPESAYKHREHSALTVTSDGYVPALGEAERSGALCMWFHTHPGEGALPYPSEHDRVVDAQLAELFRLRTGSPYYGALICSRRPSGLIFTGHLECSGKRAKPIDRIWQVGNRWRLIAAFDVEQQHSTLDIFDRNIRAFGSGVQQTLSNISVGVIGCGGTGSSVAEQLVRLGVRKILIVDPETLVESNITRVYGSTSADVGKPKVKILCEHLERIAPDLKCTPLQSMITVEKTARELIGCDLIFGCTDDNAGRLILSRMASYMLTPVIDCGVLLSSDSAGTLTGIDGRVTVLSYGSACLVCRNRIDLARAASELLTPSERKRLEGEGYAAALARTEPAVVTFTTVVGSTAVSELLERLIGYGPVPRPSEILLRCHEREISTNIALPRMGHYCHEASGKNGLGLTEPFLELAW